MKDDLLSHKIRLVLFFLILLIFWIGYIVIAISIPVDGDGALHGGTVYEMARLGQIINYHPFTISEGNQLLPIFYPKLFYTEMTSLYILMGDVTFKIIVPTLGVLVGVFVFLISREIFKSFNIAITSMIISLSSYGLITNSVDMFRMETMLLVLLLASVFCLLKFTQKNTFQWYILSILFFAACISTKQQAYIYAPLIFLILVTQYKKGFRDKIIAIFIFYTASFLLASPFLINEFITTGTLFYPGVPVVGKLEKIIADFFNITLYSVGEGWKLYGIGSDRIEYLKSTYNNPVNHLSFINPFNTVSKFDHWFVVYSLIVPMLVLGMIFSILKKHYWIILFILLQQILLFVQPLERYFLLSQVLASIVIASSIGFFWLPKVKVLPYLKIILFTFIVSYASISSVYLLSKSALVPDYSYGSYVPGRLRSEEVAGTWIINNTSKEAVLITPRTHVFSYYAKRKSLWVNQLGGKDIYEAFLRNDINRIHELSKAYGESYIIIPEYWVIDEDAKGKWISFIERETTDKLATNPRLFEKVYSHEKVIIYKTL